MTASNLAALLLGYLLGSIPFGLILTRLAGTQDIRAVGSGNIGATNVLRTGRKGLAAATLLGDMLKGTLAVLIALALWGKIPALLAGLGAFAGHLYPVWLRFKGGKGVATYVGVLIALAWQAALVFAAVWALVAAITRYSSLSALLSSLAALVFLWWQGDRDVTVLFLGLTVALWITHRSNIARLVRGTESKLGQPPPQ
ncbi:MAG TPA: glycerol-3-phosphate 1-O-acyltransferase PlsY [Xanthobacteraceae bacterium]|nr:glycerol-3-phosphate 1-O-acyltransferase PlsY [Xanthobacteraceae bacterium]